MANNKRRIEIQHDNMHDVNKVEYSLSEIKVDNRLLNKISRQNKKRR